MKPVKIGLIGAGRIGQLHGNNVAQRIKNAKLEAIAELYLNDDHKAWADSLGVTKVYNDPEQIFSDPEIDAVMICSSTDTHAEMIVKAAKAGKHIFCEKPIHYDLDVIREAIAEVDKAGVKFMTGFVRRFDHNHKKVHDTIASGKLGDPHVVKITSRDPEAPPLEYVKVSGGLFVDMMIHDFDMARYLAGSEVEEVMAYGEVRITPEIAQYNDVDVATVMLKFENKALGIIDNSRASKYGYDQRTEVQADKGCVRVENDLNDTSSISTAEGVLCEQPTWFFLERYNDAFIAEVDAFVKALIEDTDMPVGTVDGLMSVKIAKAADLSFRENRPVKLSEIK